MSEKKRRYPDYDALWHLVTMGVLTPDHTPNGWQPPAATDRKARVAMIDTSVAVTHPNLAPAINSSLALDFFSTRLGAFPYLDDDKIGALDLNTKTKVTTGLPRSSDLLAELIDRLSHGSPAREGSIRPMTSPEFSNHGTAIAGLIGSRPGILSEMLETGEPDPNFKDIPLPYCGVDPTCEIVPISTNFNPDPEHLILALLYAELIDADVILIPRVFSDPSRTVPELNQIIDGVPLRDLVAPTPHDPSDMEAWEELATLLINISMQRPIVCAAGNSQEDHGIYPANLASEHNGIIAVGAVNAKGFNSGYSATRNVTISAPSDDAQIYDRKEVRLDPNARSTSEMPEGVPSNDKFSSFDIISTDVPGIFGYSAGPFTRDDPDLGIHEFGSYFCSFGGTSASSALVAGFLSLAHSTGELAKDTDGLAAKDWLLSRSVKIKDGAEQTHFLSWDGKPKFPDA